MVTWIMLRTCEGKLALFANKFEFPTGVNLHKCLKQIKFLLSFHKCAPISELPFLKKEV